MNREILQQALYLIESWQRGADANEYFEIDGVIAAIKAELAKPINEFEPDWDQQAVLVERIRELEKELAKPEMAMSPEYLPQYIATNNIKPTLQGGGGAGGELAKPKQEQEPVAWVYINQWGECEQIEYGSDGCNDPAVTPLYTSPPRKEWVGLTEVDCDKAWEHAQKSSRYGVTRIGVFAKTIETKLKEKNCTRQD